MMRNHDELDDLERLIRALEDPRSLAESLPDNGIVLLRCAECGRLDIGHERGWTLRLDEDDDLAAFCPPCDEREFGDG